MQLVKPICAAWTSRCCFERHELVRTTAKDLWHDVINDVWRKTFPRAYVCGRFAEPEKHLPCKLCSLPTTFAPNKKLSAVTPSSNRRTFYFGINMVFRIDRNGKFWPIICFYQSALCRKCVFVLWISCLRAKIHYYYIYILFREAIWPCAICVHCLICCSKSTASLLINKNLKERCKKSLLSPS